MKKPSRRNVCLGLLGVVPVGPLPLKAQQPALPVIGFLSSGSPRAFAKFLKAFQQGLSEVGFVEGRNVSIVYRWAEGHFDELDALAAELAANPVVLIAATGGMRSTQAAKKATETIPIVTVLGFDPVKLGLVASFNKPGGNLTGTSIITTELAPKRLSLLYHLDPGIQNVAILMNPASTSADVEAENLVMAAQTAGRPLVVLKAGLEKEIDGAFASAAMSYGPNLAMAYRVVGIYAGRILNGTKPSDLPIEEPTTFEFLINLKTRRLGPLIASEATSVEDPGAGEGLAFA